MRAALARCPDARARARSAARAAELFAEDTLPLGDEAQTPDDYVRQLSATTGLPHVLVRRNMEKIRGVLARAWTTVLAGLTRGLDLDRPRPRRWARRSGHALSFVPRVAHAGRRAAQQLARRARALGRRPSRSRPRSC